MLSNPNGHKVLVEVNDEVWYQLALGHCVAGQAHTAQGR